MASLHDSLGGMRDLKRWFLWRLTWDAEEGKYEKKPMCGDASQPAAWQSYDDAVDALDALPRGSAALGFWMLEADGFWFLDVDGAHDGANWSPLALELVARFPGAMVEASSSGKGLHVIGRCKGLVPPHHRRTATPPADWRRRTSVSFRTCPLRHPTSDAKETSA